ncbi:MAG: hypothetical protein LBK73_11845 [Treponema sp.]|nr:hypothetical protein [Treponema sp.]
MKKKLTIFFVKIRSEISVREHSRALGAMREKKITDNWSGIVQNLEFGHILSSAKGGRDIEYICVDPFHILPDDTFRIENLGACQVYLNYNSLQKSKSGCRKTHSLNRGI